MKITLLAPLVLVTLFGCSSIDKSHAATEGRIYNPEAFGQLPPTVDDDGIPLAQPADSRPFPWATGKARMAD